VPKLVSVELYLHKPHAFMAYTEATFHFSVIFLKAVPPVMDLWILEIQDDLNMHNSVLNRLKYIFVLQRSEMTTVSMDAVCEPSDNGLTYLWVSQHWNFDKVVLLLFHARCFSCNPRQASLWTSTSYSRMCIWTTTGNIHNHVTAEKWNNVHMTFSTIKNSWSEGSAKMFGTSPLKAP
jgi:hypothetical protein